MALLGVLLLVIHVFQGSLAASVPCPDDSPSVLAVCTVNGADSVTTGECDGLASHADTCPFCSSGGCQLAHTHALGVAFVPLTNVQPDAVDAPALAVSSFLIRFDQILRPPN
jgi:hypothetical protein